MTSNNSTLTDVIIDIGDESSGLSKNPEQYDDHDCEHEYEYDYECYICWENTHESSSQSQSTQSHLTPPPPPPPITVLACCPHISYHRSCLSKWMDICNTCPFCRRDISIHRRRMRDTDDEDDGGRDEEQGRRHMTEMIEQHQHVSIPSPHTTLLLSSSESGGVGPGISSFLCFSSSWSTSDLLTNDNILKCISVVTCCNILVIGLYYCIFQD